MNAALSGQLLLAGGDPVDANNWYSALIAFKSTLIGGSERALAASAISQIEQARDKSVLLADIGASDCRNTKKILEATPRGLRGYELVTVDPDIDAAARTPADVNIRQHFAGRFEDLEAEEKSLADVILFSHSLYYFAEPVAVLERAAHLVRPGGRIVVAMWDAKCDLRLVTNRLFARQVPAVGAFELHKMVRHIGELQWHGTWRGRVDFSAWRTSPAVARAACAILSRNFVDLQRSDEQRLRDALIGFGSDGVRENSVFSIGVP